MQDKFLLQGCHSAMGLYAELSVALLDEASAATSATMCFQHPSVQVCVYGQVKGLSEIKTCYWPDILRQILAFSIIQIKTFSSLWRNVEKSASLTSSLRFSDINY